MIRRQDFSVWILTGKNCEQKDRMGKGNGLGREGKGRKEKKHKKTTMNDQEWLFVFSPPSYFFSIITTTTTCCDVYLDIYSLCSPPSSHFTICHEQRHFHRHFLSTCNIIHVPSDSMAKEPTRTGDKDLSSRQHDESRFPPNPHRASMIRHSYFPPFLSTFEIPHQHGRIPQRPTLLEHLSKGTPRSLKTTYPT